VFDMSWLPDTPPDAADQPGVPDVDLVLEARSRDLGGGFVVGRALPSPRRRAVGPFVFFDEMGPAALAPGTGLDIRPHPHINLATVTYLFEGEILHRDSLGSAQPIRPGAINWMTAGRGIVHSERTPAALRAHGSRLHGLQLWCGLPTAHEEDPPAFDHYPAEVIPEVARDGVTIRVLAGACYGARSPVRTLSQLFYVEARADAAATLEVPADHRERAVYVVTGAVACTGTTYAPRAMLVLAPDRVVRLALAAGTRAVLLGGDPLDGARHLYWNFVSSSPERIERAKRAWRAGTFAKVPGDEVERIPLPDD
jgi:redox-sensitive bicupin YhaK (pirin superfamily)